jgi:uncharacterized repeat protein (TIGR02059 family)
MKKSWRTFPLLAILAVGIVGTGSPVHKASAFAGGAGTSVNPYQISSCSELLEIDDTVANLSAHYVLSGNIDCTGQTVVPMVNGTTYFNGILDGNNFELIGLSITCSTGDYCALFPRVTGNAVIRNLIVKAPVIDSSAGGAMLTAVLIGDAGDNETQAMTISNVTVAGGSVTARTLYGGNANTGSLVGRAKNGSILNSHSSATVIGAGNVGGLVGTMGNNNSGVCNSLGPNIDGSSFSGSVLGHRELGGLVGSFGSNSGLNECKISNSFNTGSVAPWASSCLHLGGIVGILYESTVVSAYNTGVIGGSSCSNAGGIVGRAFGRSSGVFTNSAVVLSHSSGAVSGTGNVGGVVGLCEWSSVSQSYSSGSVTATTSFGGGLVGNSYCSIQDSYSVSDVVGAGNKGGLVGQNGSSGVITRSYSNASGRPFAHTNGGTCTTANNATNYWDTSTGAATSVCATGKTSLLMKTASTFIDAGWNFTQGSAVWSIDPNVNNGYPFHSSAGVDITAPTLASGAVSANGSTVVLTFSEALHATTAPASAFTVTASLVNVTPTSVVVNGSTVTLTLPSVIAPNVNVTVAYVAPASNSATSNSAVQDLAGNDAASFSNRAVTNNSTADVVAPTATISSPASPASSRTLVYAVVFDEAINGLTSADFSNVGTASCTFAVPTLSGTSFSVTATCTTDGSVIMRLAPNSVTDAALNTGPTSAVLASSVTIDTTTSATVPTGTVVPTQATVPSSGTTVPPVGTRRPAPAVPAPPVAQGSGITIAPTTTTSVVPSTTTTTLPSVDVPEVADGGGALVVNGQRIEATITRENNQLVIAAGVLRARISAVQREGGRAPLDSQGRIRMDQGDSIEIEVTGFGTESQVEVRMYSDPVLLGRSTVSALGSLAASYEVPESVDDGRHTVVLLGESQQSEELTFALAVFIGAESTGPSTLALLVGIPLGLAVIAALIIPAIIRRRRKDEEEK